MVHGRSASAPARRTAERGRRAPNSRPWRVARLRRLMNARSAARGGPGRSRRHRLRPRPADRSRGNGGCGLRTIRALPAPRPGRRPEPEPAAMRHPASDGPGAPSPGIASDAGAGRPASAARRRTGPGSLPLPAAPVVRPRREPARGRSVEASAENRAVVRQRPVPGGSCLVLARVGHHRATCPTPRGAQRSAPRRFGCAPRLSSGRRARGADGSADEGAASTSFSTPAAGAACDRAGAFVRLSRCRLRVMIAP